MELIFEFIFEILLEGSFEMMMSKKIPLFLRIIIGIFMCIIYIGLFLLLTYLCFNCLSNHEYLQSFIIFVIDIFYIVMIYMFLKKRSNV